MEKRAGAWTRAELLVTLLLYASFEPNHRNRISREVRDQLRQRLNHRTFGSVSIRLSNFIARDPEMRILGIKGMGGGGVAVDLLWEECSDADGKIILAEVARRVSLEVLNA